MKKMFVLITVALLMLGMLGAVAQAAAEKVDVCHSLGNGSYILINISENALAAHHAHGDAQPGEPVPDTEGKEFDEACNVVDAGILVVSSLLSFSGEGWGGWSCPPENPNVIDGGVSKTNTQPFTEPDYPYYDVKAVPGATLDGYTFPVFPHHTYGSWYAGETGWAVHNGGTAQSLYVYVYCGP